jgi:single-strand DNA-binding protein
MTSCNRVILTGRVATPPRRSYRPDGIPVKQFPLELNETKDPSGQEKPQGDKRLGLNGTGSGNLINIVAFGKLAEFKCDLLQNGQYLRIEGELKQRHWQTPEGKNRTRTEVIATDLRTLEEANRTMDLHERGEEG